MPLGSGLRAISSAYLCQLLAPGCVSLISPFGEEGAHLAGLSLNLYRSMYARGNWELVTQITHASSEPPAPAGYYRANFDCRCEYIPCCSFPIDSRRTLKVTACLHPPNICSEHTPSNIL